MKEVELPFDSIRWPDCCCSCGSQAFAWRTHSEKVVVWTVISVTSYRQVSLPIPVCAPCSQRSLRWFAAAAALVAAGFGGLKLFEANGNGAAALCGLVILAGLGIALKATKAKPLNILKLDPDSRLVRLKIRNDEVADRVVASSGGAVAATEGGLAPMLLGVGLLMLLAMLAIKSLVRYLQD